MADRHHVDVETDHEYDGIREFDNPLPRWWLGTFFGAIVFAVFYWFFYHSLATLPGSRATYAAEWAETEAKIAASQVNPEELAALVKDPEVVARGAEIFKTTCMACHAEGGQSGETLIGPNLTDGYWIGGSDPAAIHTTISMGRLEKGMPAWKLTLGGTKVSEVAAFVLSIQNTNVAGKAPQGVDAQGNAAP